MNRACEAGDWNTALRHSKELERVCADSPLLNYTIAHIHKNLNSQEKYLFYLQKASQNTEHFSVDKDILDRIWSEKYIAVHPEAAPEAIQSRQKTIESLDEENEALKAQLDMAGYSADGFLAQQAELQQANDTNDVLLWTSVGVGAAGLIVTAVGATLVAKNSNQAIDANIHGQYVKSIYNTGWTMIGSGIAITAIGVAASAFFGYKFHHYHTNDGSIDFALGLSPAYTSFEMSF